MLKLSASFVKRDKKPSPILNHLKKRLSSVFIVNSAGTKTPAECVTQTAAVIGSMAGGPVTWVVRKFTFEDAISGQATIGGIYLDQLIHSYGDVLDFISVRYRTLRNRIENGRADRLDPEILRGHLPHGLQAALL